MKHLVVDACLNGTGIRDKSAGGYIDPESLLISPAFVSQLKDWLIKYEKEHYNGYINTSIVEALDKEGRELAVQLKEQLAGAKIDYYSNALLKSQIIQ